jgi:hypothetical protein
MACGNIPRPPGSYRLRARVIGGEARGLGGALKWDGGTGDIAFSCLY